MNTRSKIITAGIGTLVVLAGGTTSALAAAPQTALTDATAINCTTAVKIAKKKAPGAHVTDTEREWEHGHRVCKVELRKGNWEYDVYVSLKNGKIVKFKRDYDD
ncbi:PepSY domain-containing protein [Nonomuraea sp. K274]|uniref:PepSY domain-containing protein n=1 Tax=Nonomuraea cypriaca TaxID=1187855 RepID=A0A931EWJ9_9ACTN|nr:PepSY domain-containing protein [Nonomuraea cypriaca]MBF8184537.1 PepSY domain-containing protein [Nonomuraea cypriaca]